CRVVLVEVYFVLSRRRRHTRWVSDWSSDVCSSDLAHVRLAQREREAERTRCVDAEMERSRRTTREIERAARQLHARAQHASHVEIGRASCRERVEIAVVAVS